MANLQQLNILADGGVPGWNERTFCPMWKTPICVARFLQDVNLDGARLDLDGVRLPEQPLDPG